MNWELAGRFVLKARDADMAGHHIELSSASSSVAQPRGIRHRVAEGLLSLGGIGAVLGGMSAIDETFRGHAAAFLGGDYSHSLAAVRVQADRLAGGILETAGLGYEHASLALLTLAAATLVLLMLRI